MTCVCGVDVGSLRTPNYVAWLHEREFTLDMYIPSVRNPLPAPPVGWTQAEYISFDAPTGLPKPGHRRRVADQMAKTPTSVLPSSRRELGSWKLYKGVIEAGIEVFWSAHDRGLASVLGLTPLLPARPTILETYPRYVIKRLWPEIGIPSKRKSALDYVETIWARIQDAGYVCRSVIRPAHDQVDSMLCAIAAERCLEGDVAERCLAGDGLPNGIVGEKPMVDSKERVLREGFIVAP